MTPSSDFKRELHHRLGDEVRQTEGVEFCDSMEMCSIKLIGGMDMTHKMRDIGMIKIYFCLMLT